MNRLLSAFLLASCASLSHAQTPDPTQRLSPDPAGCQAFARTFLGAKYSTAIDTQARELKLIVRIVERDHEQFPATMDYRPDRVDLHLEAERVAQATCG